MNNGGFMLNGLNKIIMKSEFLELPIVKSLISKFNLNYGVHNIGELLATAIYNKSVVIQIYLDKGWLELCVINPENWFWNRVPVDTFLPESTTHLDYFNSIKSNILNNSNLTEKNNNYLHYYINFIIDFLPEIFDGNFSKIEKNMEPMRESQINEIKEFLKSDDNK